MDNIVNFENDVTIKDTSEYWQADLRIKPGKKTWFTGEQRMQILIDSFIERYDLIEFFDLIYLRSYDRILFRDEKMAMMFALENNGVDLDTIKLPTV